MEENLKAGEQGEKKEQTVKERVGDHLAAADGLFGKVLTWEEAKSYSPLVLAFIGDAVFELYVRMQLTEGSSAGPGELNRRKNRFVKAGAQSKMMELLEPLLTEEEERVWRRGRNARSATMAKNASVQDYRRASGFEALVGCLYLCGREERLSELLKIAVRSTDVR